MQIAIELPDELVNRLDVKAITQDTMDFIVSKYGTTTVEVSQTPITDSLVGLLANGSLDEEDYHQHLSDKYL
jgi:hypothetical protein